MNRLHLLPVIVLCCLVQGLRAETPDPPVPLFAEAGRLDIKITAPWARLKTETEEEGPYPASLSYTDGDGQLRTMQATVERRGKTRQRICRMPPVRLRLEKKDVDGTLFEGNKSIKLVTHCDRRSQWADYPKLEMLAYRIYNAITDLSFRVREFSIQYEDSERDEVDGPRFGFMIEDDKLVGDRHGLDKLEANHISASDLPSVETSRFALFQYLIGNVDWSALSGPGDECCHNARLIGEDSLDPVYVVPYDFDSSGLVDAHYASPPESLPIRRVTQRLYRGFCVHNDGLESARRELLALEDRILGLVDAQEALSRSDRRTARRYLDRSFDVFRDERKFQREIIEECRT